MIAHLNGKLIEKNPTTLVIECGGIGYEVKISLTTFSSIGADESIKIFTQLIVREDAHLLYGFASKEEREMFNHLISVSGIGPNTAMIMLSSLTPDEVAHAIQSEDVKTIQSIKGIGIKTAQRVIIDLKDKMLKMTFSTENVFVQHNTNRFDALTALVSLGFDKKSVEKAIDKISTGEESVEQLIKQALSDTLIYPINNAPDPTQTKPQSFDLGDPSSMQQTIVYDPSTGTYVFKETMGSSDLNYRNPSMMTLEEYIEYDRKKNQSKNWETKIKEQTEENRPMEFPIKIGSKLFENFFGSDQITIRPAGSVEVSLGVNSSRYDNPILPLNQRKITRFDFQQQIQLNLVGQIGTKLKVGVSYNTQAAFDFDNVSKLEYTGNNC